MKINQSVYNFKNGYICRMRRSRVKSRILDVAGRLFYEQGYNLTGINQVIDEADIARGSLYNHFESKGDLLLEYLEQFQNAWFQGADAFLEDFTDPKKKLIALFDYRIENQQKHGYGGCPFIKVNHEISRSDTRINQKIQEIKIKFKAYISDLVAASDHRKVLSDEALTEMIYLVMEGGVTSSAIYKDVKDLRSAKKIITELL